MAFLLNLILRLVIVYFLGEVLLLPDDPRFAQKAIPLRNLIIVVTLSLLFPILYLKKKRWAPIGSGWSKYPFWADNLYLSIFALDMAGNSFDLYDSYYFFDLIPHFHGSGALSAVMQFAFGWVTLAAAGLANIIHILLEAQEYYTDVLAGTINVRGTADTINDLVVGVAGSLIYPALMQLFAKLNNNSKS